MFTISQVIGWEHWVFCTVQEIGLEDCSIKCCAGFPCLLESPGFFFWKIPGPEKSWKITLVLESPVNYSLGYWKVTANVHILHHAEFFVVDYTLTVVSKCRFSLNLNIHGLHWLRTGPGKFFTGSWKSPGFFLSVKEWEPWMCGMLNPACCLSICLSFDNISEQHVTGFCWDLGKNTKIEIIHSESKMMSHRAGDISVHLVF